MKREIYIKLIVDWEDCDDVAPELMVEDAIRELADGVTYELVPEGKIRHGLKLKSLPLLNLRFKLSETYSQQHLYRKGKGTGIVLRETKDKKCYVVIFDGTKTKRTFAKEFIEIIPQDEKTNR